MAETSSSSSEGEGPNKQSRASAIPRETWDLYKAEIKEIYITQKKSFNRLMKHMAKHRDFKASEQQYRAKLREWGFHKNNLKRTDMRSESPNGERTEHTHKKARTDAVQPQAAPVQQTSAQQTPTQQTPAPQTQTPANPELFVDSTWTQTGTQMAGDLAENYNRSSASSNWVPSDFSNIVPASPMANYGYTPGFGGRFGSVPPLGGSSFGPSFFPKGPQFPMVDYSFDSVHNDNFYGMGGFHSTGDFCKANTGFQHHVILTASLPTGPTATNHKEVQPIHIAAMGGNVKAVEWLLETGQQCVNLETADGTTPVMRAAQEGHAKIVKLLCDLNADVNATWKDCNRKAIHQATQGGHTTVVDLLLKRGADPDPTDIHGTTPFWIACQGGHKDIVQMLLPKGIRTEPIADNGRTPLHQAAQSGHLEVVKILLGLDISIDPVSDGTTPLWSASQGGHYEIVKLLLDKGAECEPTSKDSSRRPIHQAAQNGHFKVVKALLEAGALASPEKDSFESKCPSPIYLAAQSGHYDVAKILLEYKADPNFVFRKSGTTPLLAAVHEGAVKTVELLLDHGADVNCPDNDGWPPLMIAAEKGDGRMIYLLLSRGAAVDAEEKDGATALWIAAQQGNATAVSMLVAANAKSLSTRKSGRRPIHQAAQNGHFAVVKLLVEHDESEVRMTDNDGATPIGLAACGKEANRLAMMKYLHSKGGILTQVL